MGLSNMIIPCFSASLQPDSGKARRSSSDMTGRPPDARYGAWEWGIESGGLGTHLPPGRWPTDLHPIPEPFDGLAQSLIQAHFGLPAEKTTGFADVGLAHFGIVLDTDVLRLHQRDV